MPGALCESTERVRGLDGVEEFLVPDGLRTHDSCVSGHFVRRERAVACLGIYASMKDISKMRQARIPKTMSLCRFFVTRRLISIASNLRICYQVERGAGQKP